MGTNGIITNNNISFTPVKPYNDLFIYQWNIYDNMPYVWDKDLCVYNPRKITSGNLIKYYCCKIQEPYEINSSKPN